MNDDVFAQQQPPAGGDDMDMLQLPPLLLGTFTPKIDAKGRMAEMETRLEEGELQVVTRWQTRYVDRVREVHDTVTVVDVQTVVERERYVPRFFWWCFWYCNYYVLLSKLCTWNLIHRSDRSKYPNQLIS